jgi:hypothetical protein
VTAARPRTRIRRFERWLVGIGMSMMVLVLERLVIRQIQKKERAQLQTSTSAVTVGEE